MRSKAGRWLAALLSGGMLLSVGACPQQELTSLVIRDVLFFLLDTTLVQITR
jgi:hypothetical protein